MMKKLSFLFLALLSFQAIAQKVPVSGSVKKAMDQIDTLTIRNHIAYLADDKLEGRRTGTPGEELAVEYIQNQFKATIKQTNALSRQELECSDDACVGRFEELCFSNAPR